MVILWEGQDRIREEQDRIRELEKIVREERKDSERLAREEKKIADNSAREERLIDRDMKRMELEKLQTEKEIQLSLLDKEIELEKVKQSDTGVVGSTLSSKSYVEKAKMPKLPNFNNKQDSMDAYLKRFERFAGNAGWGYTTWATNLSALLQGKALDVYSRLSVDDALDYEALKEGLLKRFQLTEEGFRSKLRNSKPEVGESAQQFVVRLEDYLLRWMGLAKIKEPFEGLKDLILREQFMQASNRNLQVFLKERKVTSVEDMADIAQQYLEAHNINWGKTPKL